MSKENKPKPEPSRIPGVDEDACGQQPYWPGDAALPPGTTEEESRQPGVTEETRKPNIPGPGDPNKKVKGGNNP